MQNDSQQIVTYFRSIVNIDMVSYQNCYYLYYHEIHLRRYIFWYCPLTYDHYNIFIVFYIKLSRNFSFLTNIESVLLWYFQTQLLCGKNNPFTSIFNQQQVQTPSYCYPNQATTERQSTIGVQPIVVRYILTET